MEESVRQGYGNRAAHRVPLPEAPYPKIAQRFAMSRLLRAAPMVALLLSTLTSASAAGPYDDLLKYIPPQANTLVLVNVKAAYDSPLAKSQKWSANAYQRYKSGIGFLPPDAS